MKNFLSGILVGLLLFSGAAFAAGQTIEVNFLPLKYYFDGVEKLPPKEQQGFIYNGTTYVPLRFMAESLGKEVTWKGEEQAIYVGKAVEGSYIYIEDMKRSKTTKFNGVKSLRPFETKASVQYVGDVHGYQLGSWMDFTTRKGGEIDVEYALDGRYKKFETTIALSKEHNTMSQSLNMGYIAIYVDDEEVYASGDIMADMMEPLKVSIDITGAKKFRIEGKYRFYGTKDLYHSDKASIGLIDAKFQKK